MRWLLHGNVTTAAEEAMRRHRQEVKRLPDTGLTEAASLAEILETARRSQLEVLTSDPELAEASLTQNRGFARTVVLLGVEAGDVEQDDAIDRLFARYKRLSPGRLYTVTASRVKVRQIPPGV